MQISQIIKKSEYIFLVIYVVTTEWQYVKQLFIAIVQSLYPVIKDSVSGWRDGKSALEAVQNNN